MRVSMAMQSSIHSSSSSSLSNVGSSSEVPAAPWARPRELGGGSVMTGEYYWPRRRDLP
jgi:hypothetical protein